MIATCPCKLGELIYTFSLFTILIGVLQLCTPAGVARDTQKAPPPGESEQGRLDAEKAAAEKAAAEAEIARLEEEVGGYLNLGEVVQRCTAFASMFMSFCIDVAGAESHLY